MNLTDKDPAPEQAATFRELASEISGRLRTREAEHATPRPQAIQISVLRELHEQLTATEMFTSSLSERSGLSVSWVLLD